MYLQIVNGDLLNAKEPYIVHQCNCTSTNAKALAHFIFTKMLKNIFNNIFLQNILKRIPIKLEFIKNH